MDQRAAGALNRADPFVFGSSTNRDILILFDIMVALPDGAIHFLRVLRSGPTATGHWASLPPAKIPTARSEHEKRRITQALSRNGSYPPS